MPAKTATTITATTSHFPPRFFIIFFLFSFLVNPVVPHITTIHNASELIQFSEEVNNGANYSGTTVFLGSDVEFTRASQSHSGQ